MSSKNKAKINKHSLISIIIGFFLIIVAIASFGTSTFFSIKKSVKGDQYDSSISLRYELDPYKPENLALDSKDNVDLDTLKSQMNSIANAYSMYLLDKKVSSSNISTEIVKEQKQDINGGTTEYYRAFINAQIYNYKMESSDPSIGKDDDSKKDVALPLAYYSNMDVGRFSIIYSDGYKANKDNPDEDTFKKANLYMWDINQDDDESLTDANSKIKFDEKQNKINIQLRSQFSFGKKNNDQYADNSIKQTFYKAKNPDSTDDPENTPFMLIIHNFNGMINEMNFITYVWYQYKVQHKYDAEVKDAYWQLTDDQRDFAQSMYNNGKNQKIDNSGFIDNYRFEDTHGFQKNITDPLEQKKLEPQTNSVITFDSSNIFYALQDDITSQNVEVGKTNSLSYDFLNKYIVGIVNKDNYTDYLPDKNPTKTTVDSDGNWLTISNTSNKYFTTEQLYKSMTDQKLSLPLMNVLYPSWADSRDESRIIENGITSNVNVSLINPDFNKSALQISNASLTTLIAIIALMLIIGIMVSILYRVPGFVSFIWMILPVGLLPLIMFLSGFGLSLCLLIGILITMIVSSTGMICLLNKIKSNHVKHKTLNQSIKFGFKHSLLTILDFHVISLIAGAVMLLFPIGQIFALGICLIVGSILSFVTIWGFNYLTQMLIFNNKIGMYNFKWLSNNVYDISSDNMDKRFEISAPTTVQKHINSGLNNNSYISQITIHNDLSFQKKWFIPYILIAIALIVLGFVLAFVFNKINLSGFSAGTQLMIKNVDDITKQKIMTALNTLNVTWFNFKANADYFTISTSAVFSLSTTEYNDLVNALISNNITTYFIQNFDSKITVNFTLNSLWILLSFVALMSIYTLIRYNWYSIIPTFGSFILTCLLTFGLIAICHIPVDIYSSHAFIMIGVINYILMYAVLSAIAPKYIKINPTLYNDLKSLYIYSLTLFNECFIEIVSLHLVIIVVMFLFLPTAAIFFTVNILIGILVMSLNTNIVLPQFMYWFNNWHNMYRIRVRRIQLATDKNNLDKIDEELIDTININTRKKETD